MSTREVTVKVKLESDNRNPFPSPVAGAGGSLVPYAGGSGLAGGANASGSANPLAQNAQKAADGLAQFNQHLSKAADSMNALRDSSKGMLGALKQMLFTGGGDSQASPGHMQALWGGAKSFMGRYGMPMAVGGTALATAKFIWDRADAAGERFHKAGGEANLGHKTKMHDAQGHSYMHKLGLGEQLRAEGTGNSWVDASLNFLGVDSLLGLSGPIGIGGGKVDQFGNFRSWDHYQGVIDQRHSEAMRRTSMQSPLASINAGVSNRVSDLNMQLHETKRAYSSYQGYASDVEHGSGHYFGGLAPLLLQSKASLEKLHGKDIGSLIAEQESFGATVSSQGYGQQLAEAKAAGRASRGNLNYAQAELFEEEKRLRGFKANMAPGDKGMAPKDQEESLKRIETLKAKIVSLSAQDAQIQDRINGLTNDQTKAQKDMVAQRLSGVMQAKLQETQTLQGQKESFGMMDVGDQQYMKDVASRFKSGGIEAITPEERSMLQNSPLAEDVRIQARKRGDDSGFADIVRGSRAEARANELTGQQGQLQNLQIAINKTLNVNIEAEKTELAKTVVQAMGRFISSLQVSVQNTADLQTKAADNQAKLAGQQRAPQQ